MSARPSSRGDSRGDSRPTPSKSRSRSRRKPPVGLGSLPVLNPEAAGIDVGAEELYVAVPGDRDPQPIRTFGVFTRDLQALAAWLKACGVRSVALESTGVYWIPLYQVLEQHGFEVCLVNSRHLKHVRGRKTDVSDCQWLQHLHSLGLLQPSFRPPDAICAVRSILRHREMLIATAARHLQHMQKALTQMNLHLHHVLADLAGVSGQKIIAALLAGERDPAKLADLREPGVKASKETIMAALQGDYRREHLFVLQQAWDLYLGYQAKLRACDAEIEALLVGFDSQADPEDAPPPPPNAPRQKKKNQIDLPHTDLRRELFRLYGTDLTHTPGLAPSTVALLFAELGTDLSAFGKAPRFCSWLGLCPDPRKSGGKVLRQGTREVKHRVATAFRLSAQSLHRSDSELGQFYRRMRAKLGPAEAVTATAHKLARIFFHLVTTKESYDESIFQREEQRHQEQHLKRLRRNAGQLGYDLTPRPQPGVS
jgi:transposase